MDRSQLAYDAGEINQIDRIEFSMLPNDLVTEMSAMKGTHGVEIPDLMDKNEPKTGGLIDAVMGGSNDIDCKTCKLSGKYCDGHPAHIDLSDPLLHIGYLGYVKKILESVCLGCSNLLISKEDGNLAKILKIKSGATRLAKINKLAQKAKNCLRPQQECGMKRSAIKVDIKKNTAVINIYSEIETVESDGKGGTAKKKVSLPLSPEQIADVLDNISPEDARILGIDPTKNIPSDMIYKVFHVPSVHVRPSIRGFFSGGTTMEDGLTHQLANIVKANNRVMAQKENNNENSARYSKEHAVLLQYHVAYMIDPNAISNPKDNVKGLQIKPMNERFAGKTGRIRGNLMGKRGNFNARTVITSDPVVSVNHLRVPVRIARDLTFPVIVTPSNIEEMTKLVRRGPDNYPGANFVFKKSSFESGRTVYPIFLKFKKEEVNLHYGDVVERHLQNGDVVLLNRQPTLHKQSMMAHRIKVIDNEDLMTFGLSVAATPPYNADFDGDEMNIFIPQSLQSRIELEEIADVKQQIITPSTSRTVVGIVQDGLLGAFNLTDDRVKIDWRAAMNIISYTSVDDFSSFKKEDITGKELFSMIIPSSINMKIGDFQVEQGEITSGKLGKDILGAQKANSIIHYIWDDHGADATRNFIDNCQRLINNFNLWNGFTVGPSDALVAPDKKEEMRTYIANVENRADIEITNVENNPNYMTVDAFERKIFSDANVIRDDVSRIAVASVPDSNNFYIMMESGSKGGPNNLGQMIGCVGLQAFEGGFVPKKYNKRTLCYFFKNDDRLKSRGLCYNSYMDGMTYPEFVYHTNAGKAGIVEQVVKTSETGYAQRKLVKNLENIMIKYDGTVRSYNQIIQHTYGGNGCDTTKQYRYKVKMIAMDNEQLKEFVMFDSADLKLYKNWSGQHDIKLYNELKRMRDGARKSMVCAKMNSITVSDTYMTAINITRIVSNVIAKKLKKNKGKTKKGDTTDLTPDYVYNRLNEILDIRNTPLIRVSHAELENPSDRVRFDDQLAKTGLKLCLFDALHPKRVIKDYELSVEDFDKITEKIVKNFNENIVEPGEMVGVIAAQSLGEAVTQMTLNAFHHSGIATMTHSTMGVPRINELISYTKKPKTPQMFIYLNEDVRESREIAHKIGSYLEKTTFENLIQKLDSYYDPNPRAKDGWIVSDNIGEPFYSKKLSRNSCQAQIDNLPFMIRVVMDKEKMLDKEVTLLDIKAKLCMWWDRRHVRVKKKDKKMSALKKITSFAMMSNTDNDIQQVIHIRFNVRDLDKSEAKKSKGSLKFERDTVKDFVDLLVDFDLKGVDSVKAVNTIAKERYMNAVDGDGMKETSEYVIYTSGVNLKEIRYLNGIDVYRTFSDDVKQMFDTYGVEFARASLISEFTKAYENAGNNVNSQHIALLVDLMCFTGVPLSVDRHGMKFGGNDPLDKASFEKSIEVLFQAAAFGEIDRQEGVSSRIYTGQVIKGGTGYCNLLIDTDMIKNSEFVDDTTRAEDPGIKTDTIADAIMKEDGGEDIYIPGM
jgi:DNA-directed RNA polymerase II subunit RPB1